MAWEQARTGVLLDAEKAEEGEDTGAPIAGVSEGGQVYMGTDGTEVGHRDCLGRLSEVGITEPVGEPSLDTVEGAASRKWRMSHSQSVIADGGYESRQARDAMAVRVDDTDDTEVVLADWSIGV
jgi:hypothetical protein